MDLRITRRKLPEEIAAQIETLILNKQLVAGQPLPSERILASQLQVSRNALREAIRILERKGLLIVRPGSGTYIAEPTPQVVSESLGLLLRFRARHLFELVEARKALEVEIAGLAAERANPEDLAEIEHWLQAMEECPTPECYVDADVAFHTALAKAAKNEMLQIMLSSVRAALFQNILVLVLHHPTARQEAMEYHRRIFEAVRNKDPEQARTVMRGHLDAVAQGLRDLQEQGLLE